MTRLFDDIPDDLKRKLDHIREQVADPRQMAERLNGLVAEMQQMDPARLDRMASTIRDQVARADKVLPLNPRDRQTVLGVLVSQSFRSIADLEQRRVMAQAFCYTMLGGLEVGLDDD